MPPRFPRIRKFRGRCAKLFRPRGYGENKKEAEECRGHKQPVEEGDGSKQEVDVEPSKTLERTKSNSSLQTNSTVPLSAGDENKPSNGLASPSKLPRLQMVKTRYATLFQLRRRERQTDSNEGEESSGHDQPAETGEDAESMKRKILIKKFESKDAGFVAVPGRPTNTANLQEFDRYLELIKKMERQPTDTPFSEEFWGVIRMFLSAAVPPSMPTKETPQVPISLQQNADNLQGLLPKVMIDKWASNLPPQATKPFHPLYLGEEPRVPVGAIAPIHPILIAGATGISPNVVLTELCYATKAKMTKMMFSPSCAKCGAGFLPSSSLGRFSDEEKCCVCHHQNTVDDLKLMQVIFTLNPDVLYMMMENCGCVPSKASIQNTAVFLTVPPSVLDIAELEQDECYDQQQGYKCFVGCGDDEYCLREPLRAGHYQMLCPLTKTNCYLEVDRDATIEDDPVTVEVRVSDLFVLPGFEDSKTLYAEHGKIIFDVVTDTMSWFGLWILQGTENDSLLNLPEEERFPFTSVEDLFANPAFDHLFGNEVEASLEEEIRAIESHKRLVEGQS